MELAGDQLEVADGQPAAAEHARRLQPPVVQQQLHASYDVEGGAGRAPGDQRGVTRRGGQVRHVVHRLEGRTAAPQGQADLARQDDGGTLARHEEATADQLLGRAGGLVGGDRATCRAGRALPAVGVDVAQERGRGGAELGEAGRHLGSARGLGTGGPQTADSDRQPAHRIGDTAQSPDAAGGLPGEREVEQPPQRERRTGLVGPHDRDHVLGSGLTRDQQGIKHGKFQAVEAVESAMD